MKVFNCCSLCCRCLSHAIVLQSTRVLTLAVYIAQHTFRPMKWTKHSTTRCKTCVGKFIELILKWALHFKCHYAFKLLLFTLAQCSHSLAHSFRASQHELPCSSIYLFWFFFTFRSFIAIVVGGVVVVSNSTSACAVFRKVWTQIKWGKVFAKLFSSVGNNNIHQIFFGRGKKK